MTVMDIFASSSKFTMQIEPDLFRQFLDKRSLTLKDDGSVVDSGGNLVGIYDQTEHEFNSSVFDEERMLNEIAEL